MNSNQRIFYYDFLRAFAIFAVILCHVDGLIGYSFYNLKLAMPGLLTCIALTGVPIFFMLSGALLLNRAYSLKEFYKKRFWRFYPLFVVAAFSLLLCGSSLKQVLLAIVGLSCGGLQGQRC